MPDLFDDPGAEQRALADALELFDSYREGSLVAGETAWPVRFICCGVSGKVVLCGPDELFNFTEHVLFIPEENAGNLQLLVSPERCAECAATDHYLAYHGKPEGIHAPAWAECWIDAARHGPWVFDGDAFMAPNPLAAIEPAICKQLNADKARLAALCQRCAGLVVPQPTCVGVVPSGLHIRARFGVVRIPFGERLTSPDDAAQQISKMLEQASR